MGVGTSIINWELKQCYCTHKKSAKKSLGFTSGECSADIVLNSTTIILVK